MQLRGRRDWNVALHRDVDALAGAVVAQSVIRTAQHAIVEQLSVPQRKALVAAPAVEGHHVSVLRSPHHDGQRGDDLLVELVFEVPGKSGDVPTVADHRGLPPKSGQKVPTCEPGFYRATISSASWPVNMRGLTSGTRCAPDRSRAGRPRAPRSGSGRATARTPSRRIPARESRSARRAGPRCRADGISR